MSGDCCRFEVEAALESEREYHREEIIALATERDRLARWARRWKRAAKENRVAFEEMRGMWSAACEFAGSLLKRARRSQPHVCTEDCRGEPHDAIRGSER
jgi:hypothetical protein